MICFIADENLDKDILRGLRRRDLTIDIVRVQDVGLSGADDEAVLDFAASEDRILLTHDVSTVIPLAYDRVNQELPMPGVIAVPKNVSIGQIISDILLINHADSKSDLDGIIRYLPLR